MKPVRLDPAFLANEIDRLIALCPDMAEDEQLRADMLEGEGVFDKLVEHERETDALIDAVNIQIKRLRDRSATLEARKGGLRQTMLHLMAHANLRRIETPEGTLSVRPVAPKVEIDDFVAIPKEFLRVKVEPDKTSIKEALQRGEDVPGARLTNGGETIQIR